MVGAVRGYDETSYGEGMAEVYDDWYADVTDVEATTAYLARLAGAGPVLELGIGTGRLALPLVALGVEVQGVDGSSAMVERLRAKPGGEAIAVTIADLGGSEPPGPFTLVFVAYNTLFGLTSAAAQAACFASVAARLAPGGRFVVEAFVPAEQHEGRGQVTVRHLEAGRVVLAVDVHDPVTQVARGSFVDITEAGIRLRPWTVRYSTPVELDAMAAAAGLELEWCHAGWTDEPFGTDSPTHVSCWRRLR